MHCSTTITLKFLKSILSKNASYVDDGATVIFTPSSLTAYLALVRRARPSALNAFVLCVVSHAPCTSSALPVFNGSNRMTQSALSSIHALAAPTSPCAHTITSNASSSAYTSSKNFSSAAPFAMGSSASVPSIITHVRDEATGSVGSVGSLALNARCTSTTARAMASTSSRPGIPDADAATAPSPTPSPTLHAPPYGEACASTNAHAPRSTALRAPSRAPLATLRASATSSFGARSTATHTTACGASHRAPRRAAMSQDDGASRWSTTASTRGAAAPASASNATLSSVNMPARAGVCAAPVVDERVG
mmetsp:Transcript_864/g.3193  ORF Transcript_864/g.3193 Transcript_864/m.3193 type:complete len:307 (+) Transcript_864:41-961(+)